MKGAEGFSALPNWMIRDESIGLYALTVYAALASHTGPGGIHPAQSTIAREARCSERQVRTALNELEALGVVERVRRKDVRGRASNGYVLHPHGRLAADEESVSEVTAQGAGTPEVTAQGAGGSGTGAHLVPLIEEEPIKKNPLYVPQPGFDDFWAVYPRSEGKKAALAAWEKALKRGADPVAIVEWVAAYAASPFRPPLQFVPHASTWLNQDRWLDPLPAAPEGDRRGSSTVDLGREADAILAAREQLAVTS